MPVAPKRRVQVPRAARESRANLKDERFWTPFIGGQTVSGESVNEYSAMGLSAYYACVRAIAEDIAKLPLITYRHLPRGGKERVSAHPVYRLLHDSPNDEMTSMSFRETLTAHALGWGNGYAELIRNRQNQVVSLSIIEPHRVHAFRDQDTRMLKYRVNQPDGTSVIMPPADILHVHGLGYDGVCGYSVAKHGRESIGLGKASQKFGAAFFGNGATPRAVLEHPGVLGDTARNHLVSSWNAMNQGAGNAHKTVVLEEGMKLNKFTVDPDDAQFIETWQFSVVDVARWFRMPPHKIQHLLQATFSNIEHQSQEYVTDTLMPWMRRWEQELQRKVIASYGDDLFAEFLVEGILRADTKSRFDSYAIARQWGWMSADEIRSRENLNPLPDGAGEEYLVPLNMIPAGQPRPEQVEPEPQAEPDPEEPDDSDPGDEDRSEKVRAILPILTDAASRLCRKEAQAIEHIHGRDGFVAAADQYYLRHRDQLVEALMPAANVMFRLVGGSDPAGCVSHAADEYILRRRHEMSGSDITPHLADMRTGAGARVAAMVAELITGVAS